MVAVRGAQWSAPKQYLHESEKERFSVDSSIVVKGVFAGGNHSFATILLPDEHEVCNRILIIIIIIIIM